MLPAMLGGVPLALLVFALQEPDPRYVKEEIGVSKLELLDAGSEPRTKVAVDPSAELPHLLYTRGALVTVATEGAGADRRAQAMRVPSLKVRFESGPDRDESLGTTQRLRVLTAEVADQEEVLHSARTQMLEEAETIRDLVLRWNTGVTGGLPTGQVFVAEKGHTPSNAVTVLEDLFLDWLISLPTEPIGVGAEWVCKGQRRMRMMGPEAVADTELLYRVQSLEGALMFLTVEFVQTAEDQETGVAGALIASYRGTGEGMLTVDLQTGWVVEASYGRHLEGTIGYASAGATQEPTYDIAATLRLVEED